VGSGPLNSRRTIGDERQLVTREALRRLSSVELAVLREVMELRARHPNMSGAGFFWADDIHRAMESEWHKIVRGVLRYRIEECDETRERKEELQKRADEALRHGEIPELGLCGHEAPA